MAAYLAQACKRARIVLFVLLACVGQPGWAAKECSDPDVSTWKADTAREARICLAEMKYYDISSCSKMACKAVVSWRAGAQQAKAGQAPLLLGEIRASLMAEVGPDFPGASQFGREVDRWMADLKRAGDTLPPQLGNRRWQFNSAALEMLGERPIKLGSALDAGCTTADACAVSLRGNASLVLHGALVKTIGDGLLDALRKVASAHVDLLDKRWNNYLGASRFQYPWELAINSARFNTDGYRGFVSPPENQLIVLHPSVGVRYNKDATPKFEQTLVLELLGYYRWHWEGSSAEDLLGGSLVMAWTNAAGEEKPGWGAMLHLPKSLSVGVINHETQQGRKTSLLLSVDLAKLFESKAVVFKTFTGLSR